MNKMTLDLVIIHLNCKSLMPYLYLKCILYAVILDICVCLEYNSTHNEFNYDAKDTTIIQNRWELYIMSILKILKLRKNRKKSIISDYVAGGKCVFISFDMETDSDICGIL